MIRLSTTTMRRVLTWVAFAVAGCGGNAAFDHRADGQGGGEIVTAATVTAGVGTGGTGVGGAGGVEPGGAPPIPPLVEEDLGDVELGMPIAFDLQADALGFTALATPPSPTNSIGFQEVATPSTAAIIQNFGIDGTLWEFKRQGIITAAMPITDHPEAMPLMPGTWSFELGSDDAITSAHLSVWYRQTLDGAFHGGLVDVNFFVAPDVATQGYLEDVAHASFDGFAGLSLGTVRFAPLDSQFSVVDNGNFFDLMQETEGALGKPALNIMVVQYIDTANMPLGFSPGAPGNPLEHGSYQSALVMTISHSLDLDRVVMRHESGHFAGLMHTSEVVPGYGDVLADTPFCSDVPTLLGACPDVTNLMFPYADPSSPMLLATSQATIVQASALYRGAVEEGGGYAAPLDGSRGGGSARRGAPFQPFRKHDVPAWASRLGGLWCGHSAAPWSRVSAVAAHELLALALDPRAPDYLRGRAAMAAGRRGLVHGLVELAHDPSASRGLRIAALRAVERGGPGLAPALRHALQADPDRAIARAARRKTY